MPVSRAEFEDLLGRVESLEVNVHDPGQLWPLVRDHEQRFDTLQTPWWRKAKFRLQGWPGIRDLNAPAPTRRFWHRWWRP